MKFSLLVFQADSIESEITVTPLKASSPSARNPFCEQDVCILGYSQNIHALYVEQQSCQHFY